VSASASRSPIRVMIVDDHPLVRAAVRQAIGAPDIEVVSEASSAEEALELAPEVRPDVLLLDITLPGLNGIHLVRELAPRLPDTRIIMLTVSSDDRDVADAILFGAVGYLTKDLTPEALVRAVRGAHAGELAMSRRLAAGLVKRLVARARNARPTPADRAIGRLSIREEEVVRLIADGMTDREIADALGISSRTVATHVSSILHKYGVRNRAEAGRRYRDEA
jgi:DNA-binding NarL/FixJ family response regulator